MFEEGFGDLNLLARDPYQQRTRRLLDLKPAVLPLSFLLNFSFCLTLSTNPVTQLASTCSFH